MNVVLTSHGSTGDIFPMIALGVALRDAGHDVRFATSPPFRRDVEQAGLAFVELPPRWTFEDLSYWMGRLQLYKVPLLQLRELYRAALPHIGDLVDEMDAVLSDADILVSSYLFPMNRSIAERHGVKFATYAFAHNTVPSRFYPPEGLPRLRYMPLWVQQRWNRWLWKVGNVAVDTVINLTISRQLRSRGLPPVKDFFSKPAKLVLVGVSPGLMKPRGRLNARFRFTGYCRWQAPASPGFDDEIRAFTGGARVPVLSFGSMVYRDPAAWMRRLAAAWPRDRKLILQRGWSGFPDLPDCPHIKMIGPTNHDQLLRHASVVIHHGGAGTTATVLHAGCPHIVVPHIGDQEFFAHEVRRLGCGVKLARKHWTEKLAATVARIEADPRYHEAAQAALNVLKQEDGPAAAVREIEAFAGTGIEPASRFNDNASRSRNSSVARKLRVPGNA